MGKWMTNREGKEKYLEVAVSERTDFDVLDIDRGCVIPFSICGNPSIIDEQNWLNAEHELDT